MWRCRQTFFQCFQGRISNDIVYIVYIYIHIHSHLVILLFLLVLTSTSVFLTCAFSSSPTYSTLREPVFFQTERIWPNKKGLAFDDKLKLLEAAGAKVHGEYGKKHSEEKQEV